jgi:transposase
VLKRLKFAATSERFASTLAPEQKSLLEETLDADLAELQREIERQRGAGDDQAKDKTEKKTPKRTPLPPHLPRRDVVHEPTDTTCGCGQPMQRIGQDVAEKLDYQPGVFTVQRHVRGKWACRCCQKLVQAPVPAHVIDKGIPTAGLLAHLLVAKFMDHLPLYRQEHIFERAGHLIARSTLAQWVGECGAQLQPLVQALARELRRHVVLHADETPVAMLKPKHLRDGKTHKAYIWSYCTTSANPTKAVVFEFSEDPQRRERARVPQAEHAQGLAGHAGDRRLQRLHACDDPGRNVGAMHGARQQEIQRPVGQPRSEVGRKALRYHQCLFRIEREIEALPSDERQRIRQRKSRRVLAVFHRWLLAQRQLVPPGSATMKAIDYSLKRWASSPASSTTATCRSPTTGWRTTSGRLPLGGRTGCSPAACARASAQRPS